MAKYEYKVETINDPGEYDLSFKLILVGDSAVGKSCLSIRATKDTYESVYSPTIGFEFLSLFLNVEGKNIKLQIWDTCGQEVYRSLITGFYHNSSLAILVYAIDDENSFSHLESWLNEIRENGNPEMNIFLIGNKVDLEDKRQISKDEAQKFSEENGMKSFMETSAKTGFNAKNVFIEAAKLLYEQHLNYSAKMAKPETLDNKNINNKNIMETIDDVSEVRPKKRKCC